MNSDARYKQAIIQLKDAAAAPARFGGAAEHAARHIRELAEALCAIRQAERELTEAAAEAPDTP